VSRPGFVLTSEAITDLLDIWNYVAEDGLEAADHALARLYDAFTRLAQSPRMGCHRVELADARHRF
jgi:plasmid stabilization system protein ParE